MLLQAKNINALKAFVRGHQRDYVQAGDCRASSGKTMQTAPGLCNKLAAVSSVVFQLCKFSRHTLRHVLQACLKNRHSMNNPMAASFCITVMLTAHCALSCREVQRSRA